MSNDIDEGLWALMEGRPLPYPFFSAVARVLRAALKDRSLWDRPPKFLGDAYAMYDRWSDPDAVEELTASFVVEDLAHTPVSASGAGVSKAQLMLEHSRRSGSARRLVVCNAYKYVTALQRSADKAGYAAYENAGLALRLAVEANRLRCLDAQGHEEVPEPDVDGLDRLRFVAPSCPPDAPLACPHDILEHFERRPTWAEIVGFLGRRSNAPKRWLAEAIADFAEDHGRAVNRGLVLRAITPTARLHRAPVEVHAGDELIDRAEDEDADLAVLQVDNALRLATLERKLVAGSPRSGTTAQRGLQLLRGLRGAVRSGRESRTFEDLAAQFGWSARQLRTVVDGLRKRLNDLENEP